jgi:hypothetical protein
MMDFFTRARNCHPKKKGNLASDIIVVVPKKSRLSKTCMAKKKVIETSKHKQPAPSFKTKVKLKRQTYSKGEDKMELKKAIAEWMHKTGRYFDSNKNPRQLNQVCGYVAISYNTMMTYGGVNKETKRTLGCGVGTQCHGLPCLKELILCRRFYLISLEQKPREVLSEWSSGSTRMC